MSESASARRSLAAQAGRILVAVLAVLALYRLSYVMFEDGPLRWFLEKVSSADQAVMSHHFTHQDGVAIAKYFWGSVFILMIVGVIMGSLKAHRRTKELQRGRKLPPI